MLIVWLRGYFIFENMIQLNGSFRQANYWVLRLSNYIYNSTTAHYCFFKDKEMGLSRVS